MTRLVLRLTLITWIALGCSKIEVDNLTKISGNLPELALKTVQVDLNDSLYTVTVDNSGDFQLDLQLNNPQYIFIKPLDLKLFLLPNDSLSMKKLNGKYVFSGNQSALINNYYTDWKLYLYAVADTADSEAYYNQEPLDFLNSNDKWIEIWKKPLKELQKKHPDLNQDFLFFENARIKYWMYGDLNDYKYKNQDQNQNQNNKYNFYSYLDRTDLNDTNLLQLDEYKYFLTSYVFMKTRRLETEDKIHATSKMLDIIEESFKSETIRNRVSKDIMKLQTSRLSINDSIVRRFKNICTNLEYKKEVEKNYKLIQPLVKGNVAPDFELIGLNDNNVTLNDFKGKYLLIDVWSTTCAPCLREFPLLENLKRDLKDKNIEIITACLSDEPAWKKALSKHNLKGGQFRIEDGWKSVFRKDYLKSSGVPVYILIDPNGLIIDARAPKPSENLIEVINGLEI